MNRIFKIIPYLTVCVILAGLAGCEPEEPVSERQERLYSAENMELKKQIAELQGQFEKDMQAKQKELEQCNRDKSTLQKNIERNTAKLFEESALPALMEQVQQLKRENARLKAEIEDLNKKLEQQE
jgi:cell division protein FtsB